MREEPVTAEPEMEFCLLGPLLVRRGPVEVPVPPGKQRSLLAALLLSANMVVPVGQLSEALWGLTCRGRLRRAWKTWCRDCADPWAMPRGRGSPRRRAVIASGSSRVSLMLKGSRPWSRQRGLLRAQGRTRRPPSR